MRLDGEKDGEITHTDRDRDICFIYAICLSFPCKSFMRYTIGRETLRTYFMTCNGLYAEQSFFFPTDGISFRNRSSSRLN